MFRWNPYNPLDKCGDKNFEQFINNVISVFPSGYLNTMHPFFTDHCMHVGKPYCCKRLRYERRNVLV